MRNTKRMREPDRCEFDETDCKNDPLSVEKFVPFTVDCFLNMLDQLQERGHAKCRGHGRINQEELAATYVSSHTEVCCCDAPETSYTTLFGLQTSSRYGNLMISVDFAVLRAESRLNRH